MSHGGGCPGAGEPGQDPLRAHPGTLTCKRPARLPCASAHPESVECPTVIRSGGAWREPRRVAHTDADSGRDWDNLSGERFGSFRVVRELGRGGMGTVWLAEHALIQKRVAVKVLHAHLAAERRVVVAASSPRRAR